VRRWFAALVGCLLSAASPARAQSPVGEWRVADGGAHIRIVDCDGALWGVVSWEKKPGRDRANPDPSKRNRSTLGMPVLLHMRPGDERGHWDGEVYNAEDGNTYDASIELRSADILHVEGCALGILCGGEDWMRLAQTESAQAEHRQTVDTNGFDPAASPASLTAAAVCAGIGAVAAPGRPH
jgi:uncharacterized protein (DUF2147 family)